jgi:hypothetical protein
MELARSMRYPVDAQIGNTLVGDGVQSVTLRKQHRRSAAILAFQRVGHHHTTYRRLGVPRREATTRHLSGGRRRKPGRSLGFCLGGAVVGVGVPGE